MTSKLRNFIFILALLSPSILTEELQEVIVLEKKLSSLNGWSSNQSISSINKEELNKLDAQHPKQIFRRSPGVWISRGSGQEHLTAIRSPVLSGPGACGSFLVLEDGLPIRPTGFCNVNGLFETFFEMASGIYRLQPPCGETLRYQVSGQARGLRPETGGSDLTTHAVALQHGSP